MYRVLGILVVAQLLAVGCGGSGGGSDPDASVGDGDGDGASMGDGDGDGDGDGASTGDGDGDGDGGPGACDGVDCINGTCQEESGACVCDSGWDGDVCADPVLPTEDNLVLWLDAADVDTIAFDDSGKVETWQDKGPDDHVFSPKGPDNGPSLAGIGSRPALSFDGVDDHVSTGAFTGLSGEVDYTLFFVVKAKADNNILHGSSFGAEFLRLQDTGATVEYSHDVAPNTSSVAASPVLYEQDVAHVVTVQRTNDDISIWVDGRDRRVTGSGPTQPFAPALELTLMLGDDPAGAEGTALHGQLGEALMYAEALDFTARAEVETYLARKWLDEEIAHDVTSIGNTVLWMDAADEASFSLRDGAVESWTSRVEGFVFANDVQAEQPMRVTDGIGGMPSVRFDGADDGLFTGSEFLLALASEYTLVAVFRHDAGTNAAMFSGIDDADANGILVATEAPERVRVYHRGPPAQNGGDLVRADAGTVGDPMRLINRWDGTLTDLDVLYGDGTEETDQQAATQNMHGALIFNLGAKRPHHTIDSFTGDIAELIIFRRDLNAVEMDHLKSILDAKWGF